MAQEGLPRGVRFHSSSDARANLSAAPLRTLVLMAACLLFCTATGVAGILMEANSVALPATVDGQTSFTSVTFQQAYSVAPLVFVLPTTDGSSPCDIRIRNVTTAGFEMAQAEPNNEDGEHGAMTVHYFAMEPGTAVLPDGTVLHAGSLSTTTTVQKSPPFGDSGGFDSIAFPAIFSSLGVTPSLLAQVQTVSNEAGAPPGDPSTPWLTAAVQNITSSGAELSLERCEVDDGSSVTLAETIGYVAIMPRASSFFDGVNTIYYDAFLSADNITGWDNTSGNGVQVNFNQSFGSAPLVIANHATRDGADGGWMRRGTLTAASVYLVVDEDLFSDSERSHTDERASVVAFSQPFRLDADSLADLPLPALRYRTSWDITNNTTWENYQGVTGFHWAINANSRVAVPEAVGWKLGEAYVFPDARGTMSTLEGFSGNPTDESASFVLWFRPSDLSGQEILWEFGGQGNGCSMAIDGGSLLFTASSNSAPTTRQLTYGGLGTERYTMAVGVIDLAGAAGSTADPDLYLYINGLLADTEYDVAGFLKWCGGDAAGIGMMGGGSIGGNYSGLGWLNGFGNFSGEIALFDFHRGALTEAEIQAMWADITGEIIPEPGTLALLGLSILALARRRAAHNRRRTQ